ncbi:hypothetical protein [Rhizobium sp. RU36D]|uniref:hypothetical protein n=1 Tax=Rhizobium sp. RU36D TaxID=1907415 RepID=UPI001FCD5610|nr:hypothetical protein [Rhizobium sp. RU36D]
MTLHLGELQAHARFKTPIASHQASLHFLYDLPPILLAFELSLRGKDRLDEPSFRRILKFEVQTFNASIPYLEGAPQLDVKFGISGETLEVVKNHDISLMGLGIEIAQERDHARALHKVAATADVVRKDGFDLVAQGICMLTAA